MRMRSIIIALVVLALLPLTGVARADEVQATMQDWLNTTKNQGTIPPGTQITMENWQDYKQYMPVGMVDFFEGKFFWKMPPDAQIVPATNGHGNYEHESESAQPRDEWRSLRVQAQCAGENK